MTSLQLAWFALITLLGVFLGAMYAGLETGVYTLNPVRLTVRSSHGNPAAVRLRRQMRHPYRLLTVLLIGTNASHYLGTFGLAAILDGFGLRGWTLILVEALFVTPILFVFAETLPKDLFRTHTDRWSYRFSPFIAASRWLFTLTLILPIVELVSTTAIRGLRLHVRSTVTARQRMSQLIREGVGAGVLSHHQATLTDRALTLRDERVQNVMVPWQRVAALPARADRSAREALIRARSFSRFPVVSDDGHVRGILSWFDAVLDPERPTADLAQASISFTPETRLLDALTRMRRQRQTMAIVCDKRTERPVGLVTLKDLVEPLTGELANW